MFKIHKEELEVNGKKLTLETGKVARQADGAIIASLGETVVIATVVGAKKLRKMIKKKNVTIKSLAIHEKDVGSTEVQIGLLTDKIAKLSEHFKIFKKDKHSTIGLTKSVNKRKKLLTYLKKKNVESYQKVIKQLNLRK